VPSDGATALADFVVAAMEGATMLARAQRDPIPLRHTADILEIAIAAVTGSDGGHLMATGGDTMARSA
jgi:hypothetical protein